MRSYYRHREELSVENGCVLRGNRVVIPPPGRQSILQELHNSHPGICKMKAIARSYVFWPNINYELEQQVKDCKHCQLNRNVPPKAPLHPWEFPARPWQRLHIDDAGPTQGKYFLVTVDAYSKWIDVAVVNSPTSSATIEKLRSLFATHGLPEVVVSDNGPCFTSTEFENFIKRNGIKRTTSAPWHPSSNGQAERAVQTFKRCLRGYTEGTIETKVARFLFFQHSTAHAITGQSPYELLFNRKMRTRFTQLKPNLQEIVHKKQMYSKEYYDARSVDRHFAQNDHVLTRDYTKLGHKWTSGQVSQQTGPLSYKITLADGTGLVRRHQDQIIHASPQKSTAPENQNTPSAMDEYTRLPGGGENTQLQTPVVELRRSTRQIRQPTRLDL